MTRVAVAPRTLITFIALAAAAAAAAAAVVLGDLAYAARAIIVQFTVAVVLAMALERVPRLWCAGGWELSFIRSRCSSSSPAVLLILLAGTGLFRGRAARFTFHHRARPTPA